MARLFCLALALVLASACLVALPAEAAYVWWNADTGFWHTPTNWSCTPLLPGSGDTVEIDRSGALTIEHSTGNHTVAGLTCSEIFNLSGGTLTLNGASSCSPFNLTGGTISGPGVFSISGTGQWTSGTIASLGGVTNNGYWDILGAGAKNLPGKLTNAKGMTHQATVDLSQGSLINSPLGTYDIQTNTGFTNISGGGSITNNGLFRKTTANGTAEIAAAFNNNSNLKVLTGTLLLSGGGNSMSGTFDLPSPSSSLQLSGNHTMNGNCILTGWGTATLGGGTLSVGASGTLASNLPGGFKFTGGHLSGAGSFVSSNLDWSGGSMTGLSNFTNNGVVTMTGPEYRYLQNSTFVNNGTVTHTGLGSLVFNQFGELAILPAALYEFRSDAGFADVDGSGKVYNYGTLRKAWSSGTTYIDAYLDNSWLVDIVSGSMILCGGGYFGTSGANVTHQATLGFNSGLFTVDGEFAVTGGGMASLTGGTLSFEDAATARLSLEQGASLAGTTVTGYGNLINGWNMNWSAGTVTGSTHFINEGALTISGSGSKLLSNALFFNNSEIIQTASQGPRLEQNATLTNMSGATYEFRSDSGISGTGTVRNSGLFRKTQGSGTSLIEPFFDCSGGSLNISTGSIKLTGGGTFWDAGGTITFPGNLNIAGGDFTANAHPVFTGIGSATLSGGTLSLALGAQMLFGLDGGLQLAGTALKGPGTLISGVAGDWSVGNLADSAILSNEGTMTISGTGTKLVQGSRLMNWGTITHNGTGSLDFRSQSTFDNQGTYEFRSDAGITTAGGGSAITNHGVFRKDWANGVTTIQPLFNNRGMINVRAGTLRFTGGGDFYDGAADIVAPATLDFLGGIFNVTGNFEATGSGSVILGAMLTLSPGAHAHFSTDQGFHLAGGAITGEGAAYNGLVGDWTSGAVAGGASLINQGTFTISGDFFKYLEGGHLVNLSVLNHAGMGVLNMDAGSTIDIPSTGTYNMLCDGVVSGNGQVNNSGLFRKSAGTGACVVSPTINNTGKVQVDSGALIFDGPAAQLVDRTLSAGQWVVDDGCTLDMGGEEPIWTNQADVTLIGDCAFPQFESVTTNSGTLRLLNGRTFRAQSQFTNSGILELGGGEFMSGKNINTGQWSGAGVVTGNFSNRGAFSPTPDETPFQIDGSYTQTSTGRFDVVIGGRSSWQFSRLSMGSNATLSGTLKLTLANGFVPQRGDTFEIIGCRFRSGTFSSIQGADLSNGLYVNVMYTSRAVVLVVGDVMPTPTVIGSAAAAKQQELGSWLSLPAVVSAVFPDGFFVQDGGPMGGLRVVSSQASPSVGQRIQVAGQLTADGACLTLASAQYFAYADALQPPKPVFTTGKQMGGASLGEQDGVADGVGLNNVGLLVRVAGNATYISPYNIAYLDDGSGLADGNTVLYRNRCARGIRIIFPSEVTIPAGAARATVTGISYRVNIGGLWQRAVLVRSQSDISWQ